MLSYLVLAILLLILLAACLSCQRSAQLKRLAHRQHMRYEKEVPHLLTLDNFLQVALFRNTQYRFTHVLTTHETNAFIRICQAHFSYPDRPTVPAQNYTLLSTEITRATLPRFILAPRHLITAKNQSPLPPQLAQRYTLQAPAGYQLPAALTGLLANAPTCYLETTPTALIYHEYKTLSVRQLLSFKLRASRLTKVLLIPITPPAQPAAVNTQMNLTDLQTQLLAQSLAGASGSSLPNLRYLYGIFLLLSLGGLLFLTHYVLHYGLGK